MFLDEIELNSASRSSGHEVYANARSLHNQKKIIIKKNKNNQVVLTHLELAFSSIARLFLPQGVTSDTYEIVQQRGLKEHSTFGLLVSHLCYTITKRHPRAQFLKFVDSNSLECEPILSEKPEDLKIYFFNNLPQGFFAKLIHAESEQKISIDYDSLASILTTSYTLQEDDLHKGNHGFYIIEKDERPHVVFIKIDHDLMFVDSIMGFYTRRPFHLFHGKNSFDIMDFDVASLPGLGYSVNSYWPTKFSYLASPFDSKEYHSFADIDAYLNLRNNKQFIEAKWRQFYKSISISNALIMHTLQQSSITDNPAHQARCTLIAQALALRLSQLRAVLYANLDFRNFVQSLAQNDAIFTELNSESPHSILKNLQDNLCFDKTFCDGVDPQDTPLHIAIKRGEYYYDETLSMFHRHLNTVNSLGQTPLDCALQLPESNSQYCNNRLSIIKHLLQEGATSTEAYRHANLKQSVQSIALINPYLSSVTDTMRGNQLQALLKDISNNYQYTLKDKKILSIQCFKKWISLHFKAKDFVHDLQQFKTVLNASIHSDEAAPLLYIRQLRSSLWIVRQIRGLYGYSSTLLHMNSLIEDAIQMCEPKPKQATFWCALSFFKSACHVIPDMNTEKTLSI